MRKIRRCVALAAFVVAMLAVPAISQAAITSVFGGDVSCSVQGDGVRFCGSSSPRSTTATFDGVPIDVNVAFPPEPAAGTDGNYPLVMLFHGYGGGKLGLGSMQRWLDRGYATFSMTDRGFRESCGSGASRAAAGTACDNGYVRLIDTRYEVRDAQFLAGRLVDQGLVAPTKLAAIGGSYGGGLSASLAMLRNRMQLPNDAIVPWTSPGGVPMELAAAAPSITWTDLAYALAPNGSTLDYVADAPYRGRPGVVKESLINGLYISGQNAPGYYAPPGEDPSADLTSWRDAFLAGEPYEGTVAEQAIAELQRHHSSYYINDAVDPAPMLFANGFTDDLFPADEALRLYNKIRTSHPDAHFSLVFGEIAGHPRSTSKANVNEFLRAREIEWFDHFVKGEGAEPFEGVRAFTQTCPNTEPSGGPFEAASWAALSPGEIQLKSTGAQTLVASAGDQGVAATFDPVTGGGSCASVPVNEEPGTLNYSFDAAPAGGFTLMGSPTVIAKFTMPGNTSQVAARLLDVSPEGQETLIARGLWRPAVGGPTKQVFQLHPNGWHFAEGHVARLQLLPKDDGDGPLGGYGRPSNDQQDITVKGLQLRLPTLEKPGALKGLINAHAPKFVPQGYKLARDFRKNPRPKLAKGAIKAKGKRARAEATCPEQWAACRNGEVVLKAQGTGKRAGRFKVATGDFKKIKGGRTKAFKLTLTDKARKYLEDHARLHVTVKLTTDETIKPTKQSTKITAR